MPDQKPRLKVDFKKIDSEVKSLRRSRQNTTPVSQSNGNDLTPEQQSIYDEALQKTNMVIGATLDAIDLTDQLQKEQEVRSNSQAQSTDGKDVQQPEYGQPQMAGDNPTFLSGVLNTIGITPQSQKEIGQTITDIKDKFQPEINYATSLGTPQNIVDTSVLVSKYSNPAEFFKTANNVVEGVSAPLTIANTLAKQNPVTKYDADLINKVFEGYSKLQDITIQRERAGLENNPVIQSDFVKEFDNLRKNVELIMLSEAVGMGIKESVKPIAEKLGLGVKPVETIKPIQDIHNDINKLSTVIKSGEFEGQPLSFDDVKNLSAKLEERKTTLDKLQTQLSPEPINDIKPLELKTVEEVKPIENKPIEQPKTEEVKADLPAIDTEIKSIPDAELQKEYENIKGQVEQPKTAEQLPKEESKPVEQKVEPKVEKKATVKKDIAPKELWQLDKETATKEAIKKRENNVDNFNKVLSSIKPSELQFFKIEVSDGNGTYFYDPQTKQFGKSQNIGMGHTVSLDSLSTFEPISPKREAEIYKSVENGTTQVTKVPKEIYSSIYKRQNLINPDPVGKNIFDRVYNSAIDKAIQYDVYKDAIIDGKMTATEVKRIIESANKKVPDEILELAKKDNIKPEAYTKAVKNLKNRGSQINSNPFDPTVFKDIYTIGKYHIEQGLKNFSEWSRKVIQDVGRWVKPHLEKIWNEVTKNRTPFDNVVANGIGGENKPVKLNRENIDKFIALAKAKGIDTSRFESLVNRNIEKIKVGSKPQELPSINLEKINAPQDVKTLIEKVAEADKTDINKQRRETITNAETKEFAKSIGLKEDDIISINPGEILNSEQTYAARDIWINAGRELMDFVKTLPEELTAEQQLAFKEKMMKFKGLQKSLAGLRSEAGRLLQQWNIPADGETAMLRNLSSQLKRIGAEDGDILNKLNKMQNALEPTWKDKAYYIWYNSILSNPLTDVANIIGNTSNLGFETITLIISNPLQAKNIAKGMLRGVKEGAKDIRRIYKMEEDTISKFDLEDKSQLRRYEFRPKNNVGKIFRGVLPLTRLRMEDAFFRRVFEGLKSETLTQKLSKKYNEPIDVVEKNIIDVMNNPSMLDPKSIEYRQVMRGLNDFVDYGVFQQGLGEGGRAFARLGNVPYIKPFIPFVRISANIMKVGANTTPLGFARLLGKEFREMPKGIAKSNLRADIVRRAIAGSLLYTGILKLVGDGVINITGSGAESEAKRDLSESEGFKPNHIYFKNSDGTYSGFSYQNLQPFNIPLAFIGNYLDDNKYNTRKKEDEYSLVQKGTATMLGFAETFTDQSFLSSFKDLFSAIKYKDPNYLTRFAQNLVTPNIIGAPKDIKGLFTGQKPQFEAETFVDNLKRKAGITDGLRPKVNVFGEQKNNTYERFPFPVSNTGKDEVAKFLLDNNITVSVPTKETKINGQPMSEQEYDKYKTESGRLIKRLLQDNLSELKKLSSEEADKTVEDITRIVRDQIKEDLGNKGTPKKTYTKQYNDLKFKISKQLKSIK